MVRYDVFTDYHPLVNLLYFSIVLGFSITLTHPLSLCISFACACCYCLRQQGRGALRRMVWLLPVLVLAAVLNPLFNHEGATILAYLPSGNPLTLESLLYGLVTAAMLGAVLCWSSCFHTVMTSDKLVYLFGRLLPSLSLLLSMSLRFVPHFQTRLKAIAAAQKGIGRDISHSGVLRRVRVGLGMLSILVTWALENALETADSMRGRGYGLPGRTAFSLYRMTQRDAAALLFLLTCASAVLAGALLGACHFRYFPTLRGQWRGAGTLLVFVAHAMLAALPLILNVSEDLHWTS